MAKPMPSFDKSPAVLVARFDDVAARHPEAARRKMFGYPALFVGGNLATCLFRDGWALRLSDADCTDALAVPGITGFSPMPGRTMRGWALLPPEMVADDAVLGSWVQRSLEFAASLPPK